MDKWKFALAVIRETRMMPVFALGLLGAALVLAPDMLEHYGFAVGEGSTDAFRTGGLIAFGAMVLIIPRMLDR